MSDQDGRHASAPLRPSPEDAEALIAHWKAQGQPWRTQREITQERKDYLANQRLIPPDIEQGRYPFKDVEPKLTRADIEWLLATHESGGICGPVDCSDERQREREGLDLRGAHLEGADLSGLPLARMRGGLTLVEWVHRTRTEKHREMAAVHLQEAFLRKANLQEATLEEANLQEAGLVRANLQKAYLWRANLQEAELLRANLQEATLLEANLQQTSLEEANLQEADLSSAQLEGAHLEGVTLGNKKQVGPQIADSQWRDVNLAVIQWSQVKILGDEYIARQKKDSDGNIKEKQERLSEYEASPSGLARECTQNRFMT